MNPNVQQEGPKGFFNYEWSSAWLAMLMFLFGIVLILLAQLVLPSLTEPWMWLSRFLQDAGVAFLISGTASTLIEQLVKRRTRAEFEKQMKELLGKTADSLSSEILSYLAKNMRDLESRVEQVRGAIRDSNIEMIFARRKDGFSDMARAIREARQFIYVMGVSLREFSKLDTPLCNALKAVHLRISDKQQNAGEQSEKLEVKMLILNNQSLEALQRSSIEEKRTFESPSEPEYKISNLFRDTRDTILDIQASCPEIQLRVYNHLSLFLLVTERYVFMEPYHSGVKSVGLRPLKDQLFERVAELVPMIQFRKESEPGPYEQFLNHFIHVFAQATPPTIENTDINDLAPSHADGESRTAQQALAQAIR